MIVAEDGDGLVLIEQEAHAQLTGDLAAHLPQRLAHHAAFVAAARVHDNGWREADAAPTIDGDGRPHTFNNVPDDVYEDLWRRGIRRAAAVDGLVGLLVGLHGARFFETRQSPGMRQLVREERARQDEALADLGLGGSWEALPAEVRQPSDWIAMLDALSLLLCGAGLPDRISPQVDGEPYVLARTAGTVMVDPWPYEGGPVVLEVRARRLEATSFASREQLGRALGAARPFAQQVTVAPGA